MYDDLRAMAEAFEPKEWEVSVLTLIPDHFSYGVQRKGAVQNVRGQVSHENIVERVFERSFYDYAAAVCPARILELLDVLERDRQALQTAIETAGVAVAALVWASGAFGSVLDREELTSLWAKHGKPSLDRALAAIEALKRGDADGC